MTARRSSRITTHDVAARAGVSQATVSLVLGGNPKARVADATRARVLQAAEDLGYRPNILARGLVRGRSYALGVMVPDLANTFYLDVVRGIERVAASEGYAVLLCDTRETSPARHLEALLARRVDGVILDPAGVEALPPDDLSEVNLVVVEPAEGRFTGVGSDAAEAGRLAAQHLLELGHREIAFMGPADVHAFRLRERGFVRALRDAGVELPSERLRRAPATLSGGRAAMQALLTRSEAPTAVFCVNDLLALGALKACGAAGVGVPGEISLVGCDDIEMARVVTPELTTVHVAAREIGARAARLLLRQIEQRSPGRSPAPLPVKLVVRGTTAPPTPGRAS